MGTAPAEQADFRLADMRGFSAPVEAAEGLLCAFWGLPASSMVAMAMSRPRVDGVRHFTIDEQCLERLG
jgi:hypothetical protein